ncbi:hypothetical protein HDR63_03825 [bacterium]|nr:hypothetical protein [bacterium]
MTENEKATELTEIFQATQTACRGISDRIGRLKNMTTSNAVVSGVGTAASGGALYAGIRKEQLDKQIAQLQEQICAAGGCDAESVERMSDSDFFNILTMHAEIAQLQRLYDKSVSMGNWRTGLMATGTATHITSAILSGLNKDQSDLIQQISACNAALDILSVQNIDGINPMDYPIISKISAVKDWCQPININEIEKIERKQKAIMGVSIAGAATGTVGTITSATANSAKVRDDNSERGRDKEKKLNTTANVMSGTTAVMSGVSTGLSISSLSNINKLIKRIKLCEDVF